MNPAHSLIAKYNLLTDYSLASRIKAAHELAEQEGINYPAAKMRITRQLARARANIEAGRDPYADSRGGAMAGAGRPENVLHVCTGCGKEKELNPNKKQYCDCNPSAKFVFIVKSDREIAESVVAGFTDRRGGPQPGAGRPKESETK